MKVIVTFKPKEEFREDLQKSFPEVEFLFYRTIEDSRDELPNAEVIVTMGEDLTDEHIEMSQNLKWIMVTSAGLEKMPFQSIKERGILVTNAKGIHKIPMAEFTFGLMLQHAKQLQAVLDQEKEAVWSRRLPTTELHGSSLLVIGAGAIGGEIARIAKAFQMKVSGVNSNAKPAQYFDNMFTLETFEEQLPHADYVVAVLPSTESTKSFIGVKHFKKMKDSSVFINIGRGDLVSEDVLTEVVKSQLIGHIYLDVFKDEPLPKDHPFWKEEGITVTPHLSSITKNYLPRAFDIFKQNLITYSKNNEEFINIVDVERGY
ncbi:D-2-hydroxyacid dehydrogenase [Rossellomorea aquimaris]|uniref:D-2-hydroxyacid dehydrogenase n=1 Tax=Rossellomorea aquimaris TaxID=189382 RepID=UPI0007D0B7D4|nr:D-2-hydroxyacid dehydrogenase [Rossellomorea aquimaris]